MSVHRKFMRTLTLGVVMVATSLAAPAAWAGDEPAPAPEDVARVLNALSDAFSAVSLAVQPFVVSINTETEIEATSHPDVPGFREFFGRQFGGDEGETFRQRGLGSGVIVTSDGYILTNNHVAGDADQLEVELSDGRVYDAKLVGADSATDIAVIKIDADEPLSAASLGDSDKLRVGDWVMAVGSPFHLTQSVTAGIVSAMGRSYIGRLTEYEDFIQTDAAINPGNSGGPLVNLRGEVVGINTAIATRSGGYQGIGFAIPVNMARAVMTDLIDQGRVVRGWLGVEIRNLDNDMAESLGLDRPYGVIVERVTGEGPSESAGLEIGDVIIKFNGEIIRDSQHLRSRVALSRPGTRVEVQVARGDDERTFWVTLGELDLELLAQQRPDAPAAAVENDIFGMELISLTRDRAEDLGTSVQDGGVVVESVGRSTVAESKGVQPGDVIREVARQPVDSVETYRRLVEDAEPGEPILLLIERDGRTRFVALRKP
jgi:serine protease Do